MAFRLFFFQIHMDDLRFIRHLLSGFTSDAPPGCRALARDAKSIASCARQSYSSVFHRFGNQRNGRRIRAYATKVLIDASGVFPGALRGGLIYHEKNVPHDAP
jgi:hypothetical protein